MKKGIMVLLLGLILAGCSMEQLSKKDLTVSFVEEHSFSKDVSYTKILEWLAKNYTAPKEVIQLQNKEDGTIIGKGTGKYKPEWDLLSLPRNFYYTLSIKTKDNKTKFEFLFNKNNNGDYPPARDNEQFLLYFTNIKNSIMSYMANKESDNF